MVMLCAWAVSPSEKSANSATTALCAGTIFPGKGVKGQQIWLGEIRLDAILSPTRLKVHGTNWWTRSTRFMVNLIWTRIGSICKQIYMCFGHDNAGPFVSCIKENKELAWYCHEERSCMGFYQIKETIKLSNEIILKTRHWQCAAYSAHAYMPWASPAF